MKDLFLKYWLWFAFFMSIYWGIRNLILYTTDLVERLGLKPPRSYFLRKRGKFWGISLIGGYEFIFNFVGSLAGWCCLYVFIKYADFTKIELSDFVFLILGIMGLGGRLPRFILGIIKLPTAVANYISKKLGLEIE